MNDRLPPEQIDPAGAQVGDLLRWDGNEWVPHVPPIIVLAAAAAVPAGTPIDTIIARKAV